MDYAIIDNALVSGAKIDATFSGRIVRLPLSKEVYLVCDTCVPVKGSNGFPFRTETHSWYIQPDEVLPARGDFDMLVSYMDVRFCISQLPNFEQWWPAFEVLYKDAIEVAAGRKQLVNLG